MNLLPPVPSWDAAHPIVVHLPLGLLMIAPLLIVLAAVMNKKWRKGLSLACMVVIAVSAIGSMLAVMSGEAAERPIEGTLADPARDVLEQHEKLGELTRTALIVLAVGYAGLLGLSGALERKGRTRTRLLLHGVYLLLFLCGMGVAFNAAHLGGRLVHEFGVHAPISRYIGPGADAPPPLHFRRGDRD